MLPKLREAQYRRDYCIWLKFADGVEGEVDLEAELWGEVFQPLKEKARFAEFSLDRELETIVWPNGADFAPEFLTRSCALTIGSSRRQKAARLSFVECLLVSCRRTVFDRLHASSITTKSGRTHTAYGIGVRPHHMH